MADATDTGETNLTGKQAVLRCGHCNQTGMAEEMCENHLNCSPDAGMQVLKSVPTASVQLPFDH